jgi:hypothetical protein
MNWDSFGKAIFGKTAETSPKAPNEPETTGPRVPSPTSAPPLTLRNTAEMCHGEHVTTYQGGTIYVCPHRDGSEENVVLSIQSPYGQRHNAVTSLTARECRNLADWLHEAAEVIETDPLNISNRNTVIWTHVPTFAILAAIKGWFAKPPLHHLTRKQMIDMIVEKQADRYSDFRNMMRDAIIASRETT